MQTDITVQWEVDLRGDLSSKSISTLQAATPESCRALYIHCLVSLQGLHRGDTSFFNFFFLHCLKVMPFVMYCAKLEFLAVCWVWEDMIQIYAMLLFSCSVKALGWGR